jgi:hypothetical protein
VSVVLLLSDLGLAQQVVTARATIPFDFWAQGHEFQAGDYVFDHEVPGSAAIHREGTNSGIGVSIILYAVPQEKETPRVIFVSLPRYATAFASLHCVRCNLSCSTNSSIERTRTEKPQAAHFDSRKKT